MSHLLHLVDLFQSEILQLAHNINKPVNTEYTPCLKKLCQCYFVNNSVKHWTNLIIFGVQHREETSHI